MIFLEPLIKVLKCLKATGTDQDHVLLSSLTSLSQPAPYPFSFLPHGAQGVQGRGPEQNLWGCVDQQLCYSKEKEVWGARGAGQTGLFYLQYSLSQPE